MARPGIQSTARRLGALALGAWLVVAGCQIGEPQYTMPPFSIRPPSSPTPTPAGSLSYDAVMAIAVGSNGQPGDIDAFWRRTFPLIAPGQQYEPPAGLHGYARGVAPPNECARASRRNAYYCSGDRSIAWEIDFFRERQREIGDLAPLVIMAHEWGHHIQEIWQHPGNRRRGEAQADCYAGLYIDDALRRGVVDYDGLTESIMTWYQWGTTEYATDSWFSESEHGPGQARAWAFIAGMLTGDPVYCISFNRYEPSSPRTYPGYTLRVPPGTTVAAGPNDAYDLLAGEMARAVVQARRTLPAGDAVDQMPEFFDEWFGLHPAEQVGAIERAFGDTLGGSGAVVRYVRPVTYESGVRVDFYGALALHVRPAGGGIVFDVYRPGGTPAADDSAAWEPIGDYLYLLLSGLCPTEARTFVCVAP